MGKQIRNAEKEKIPVMAVVGAKEVETNTLSIRTRASIANASASRREEERRTQVRVADKQSHGLVLQLFSGK